VETCPTGVLEFGQVDPSTGEVLSTDDLVASLARAQEQAARENGRAGGGDGAPAAEGEQYGG
jgi:hypothetical protein